MFLNQLSGVCSLHNISYIVYVGKEQPTGIDYEVMVELGPKTLHHHDSGMILEQLIGGLENNVQYTVWLQLNVHVYTMQKSVLSIRKVFGMQVKCIYYKVCMAYTRYSQVFRCMNVLMCMCTYLLETTLMHVSVPIIYLRIILNLHGGLRGKSIRLAIR